MADPVTQDTTTALADAIVLALNDEDNTFSFTAVRLQLPIFNIKELDTLHVSVIARGRKTELIARGETLKTHRIEIGIQQKVSSVNDSNECDSIGLVVETITDFLVGSMVGGCTCIECSSVLAEDSTFAKEHIQDNVLTSVLVTNWM